LSRCEAAGRQEEGSDKPIEHKLWIAEHDDDMPEIRA
jgi:hypothetical protein